ncbi:MAG: glucoamylase family protein [Candidatus Paceibacterota bacterium]
MPFKNRKKSRYNETILKRAHDFGNSTILFTEKATAIALMSLYRRKLKTVLRKYKILTSSVSKYHFVNQEIEFIFENFFIVESTISELINLFNKKEVKSLPLVSSHGVKKIRLYSLFEEMLAMTENKADEEILIAILEEYQKESPLSIQEVNLAPEIIRLILVERFGSLIDEALKKIKGFNESEKIHLLIKKSIASFGGDPSRAVSFLASRYKFIPLNIAICLLGRLSKEGAAMRLVIKWIHLNLEKQGIAENKILSIEKRIRKKHLSIASNSVESLHWLNQVKWDPIAEKINVVDSILTDDPKGVFSSLERESKNLYRDTIVRIAERISIHETEVARTALSLSLKSQAKESEIKKHIGYYLLDPSGTEMLEKETGYNRTRLEKINKFIFRDHPQSLYLGTIGFFSFLSFTAIFWVIGFLNFNFTVLLSWFLIAAIFSLEIGVHASNALFGHFLPVRRLPRIRIEGDIEEKYRTFVAVPCMIRSKQSIQEIVQKLEVRFLGNSEKNIFFALLFDFKDSSAETLKTDADFLNYIDSEISRLNNLYGKGEKRFFGLTRKRIWNEKERVFMGWERKRGKLREFNKLLRGEDTSYINGKEVLSVGRVQYVITLDEDTELPHDTARKLIGTIIHPLNSPVLDKFNRVIRGYGIIQPRVAVRLEAAYRSLFSRLYSAGSGIDSYSNSISNFYQDLFGSALFFGKGIYHIDAIKTCMSRKIPDNTALSHDLLEGIYSRTGFAGDIVIFDGFPNFYHEFIIRLERWIRGDWQIIGWLSGRFGYGSPHGSFSLIDKFKIFDNLRRSLLPVVCFFSLALGLAANLDLAKISMLILAVFASPNIFPFAIGLIFLHSVPFRMRLPKIINGLSLIFLHTVLNVFSLFQRAYISMRAIIVTTIRLYFTKKNLLQWDSFYDIGSALKGSLKEYYLSMKESVLISLFLLVGFNAIGLTDPWLQAWLIIWCTAPIVIFLISSPDRKKEKLKGKDASFARTIAYRNALYFLENAKEETHWLIPDHIQEYPKLSEGSRVATSPTNIGMHILSLVPALDFGYISPFRYADRTQKIFISLSKLYRHRGHLINWYDIKSLEPLSPQYISSVDSANFLISLVTVSQAYAEMPDRLIIEESAFKGLVDAMSTLIEDGNSLKESAPRPLKKKIQDIISSSHRAVSIIINKPAGKASSYDYFKKLTLFHESLSAILKKAQNFSTGDSRHFFDQLLFSIERAIEMVEDHMMSLQSLVPSIRSRDPSAELYASKDSLAMESVKRVEQIVFSIKSFRKTAEIKPLLVREIGFEKKVLNSSLSREAKEFLLGWYGKILEEVDAGAKTADRIISLLHEKREDCKKYIKEADFKFLYNEEKELFRIGYNITFDKLDEACYNFIASESNSVSFMAILKKDVPQKHWFSLNRKLVRSKNLNSLISWGGSLFEYLTSLIFFPSHPKSLLGSAARSAIKIHMQEGKQYNILWGMGESAYYQFDESKQYQYQIFGSPKIGLKRNLTKFLVSAPYTSALSLPFFPNEAIRNLRSFFNMGCLGRFGFYDSLDYFGKIENGKKKPMPAKVYYAHHQGFTLASIANILEDGRIQNLFHSNPAVQSLDVLFEEKISETPIAEPLSNPVSIPAPCRTSHLTDTGLESKRFVAVRTSSPRHAFISNGSYSVCLTNRGTGTSLYKGIALTRPSLEEESDSEGVSFFLQDKKTKNTYSLSPRGAQNAQRQKIIFYENKAEFLSFSNVFDSALSVSVDSHLPIEARELFIQNNGDSTLRLDLMAYAEVSLAEPEQIFHNPHYHHLLVQAEIIAKDNAVIFHRPNPLDRSKNIYCAHMLVSKNFSKKAVLTASREEAFDRFAKNPFFISSGSRQKKEKVLAPLDPASRIMSEFEILPGESVSAIWIQIAAESYKEIKGLIKKYKKEKAAREITLSAIPASASFTKKLGISQERGVAFQEIASKIIAGETKGFLHKKPENQLIHCLWKMGISGDNPIALFLIRNIEDMQLLKQAIQCYEYWKSKEIEIDIVILNNQPGSYFKALDDEVDFMIRQAKKDALEEKGGSIYQVRSDLISLDDREALLSIARFVIDSQEGTLSEQANKKLRSVKSNGIQKFTPLLKIRERKNPTVTVPDLFFYNSWGGFDKTSKEYVMTVSSDHLPKSVWSHVIASEDFGTVVSDSGSAYTWSEDSYDNRISSWTNDIFRYKSGEIVYLRDDDTGEVWNPTPLPVKTKAPFLIRYGFGYASYENSYSDLDQKLTIFVPRDDKMKLNLLSLKNKSGKDRHVTLYYYLEPSASILRDYSRSYIFFDYDPDTQTLFFNNGFRNQMTDKIFFMSFGNNEGEVGWTSDKGEFIGRTGSYESPKALKKAALSNHTESGLNNCAALSLKVAVPAGEEVTIPFFVGEASSVEEAKQKALSWKNSDKYEKSLDRVKDFWAEKLNKVSVHTEDLSLDFLMNGWLLYQALSSRVYAKTGFYQPSGAYGFRDQLQDVCAFIWTDPSFVREFIIKAASRQFKEGDSLNWWHDHNMFGSRNALSDHQMWLAYTLFEYIEATGDISILDEEVPFLDGPDLSFSDKKEWAGIPEISSEKADIFEHAMRAIEKSFVFGSHGLPLMGLSDWNDGLSRVGHLGKGESVWVAWFLLRLIDLSLPQLKKRGQKERFNKFIAVHIKIKKAIEKSAWDGKWYRRAFFDNGSVLGSKSLKEFKIDSVAQSWAVLSGHGDKEKSKEAHKSMSKLLFKDNYFSLIDPALKKGLIDPGYVKDYPAGIRENGAQYNHAALWAAQSYAHLGDFESADKIIRFINPIDRSRNRERALEYRIEPYVVASDIYGGSHAGRGGWSWYTGSASLMYVTILEHILGVKRKGSILSVSPRIPKKMGKVMITLPCGKSFYHITIKNPKGSYSKILSATCDDIKRDPSQIPFIDDGKEHQIKIDLA